ncbi:MULTISPECIES: acyl-CoA dehydrogenase family protein [unclassified Ruegeria]|uniref:acyl-CoA dehydrogenase family protein n=1 Tax=unclassified Ruegeria TaxID=2625375 RepID=UPI0014898EF5
MHYKSQINDLGSDAKSFAVTLPDVTAENLRGVWKTIAEFGSFNFAVPSEFGGSGRTAQEFCSHFLGFGEGCRDNGLAMAVISQIWTLQKPLIRFGSSQVKAAYLPKLLAGETLGAFALTELEAGSDALALRTRADRVDGGYVLNGSKAFVGMGPNCDIAIVFAQTDPEKGRWGLSAFVVHAEDQGFIRHPAQGKLGLNSVPLGELEFRDCRISEDRRLGPEGAGAAIIQTTLDWERCFILTSQVGAMRRQLAECTDFAAARNLFGQSISEFQSVANRIADMRVRLETCELMLERAADLYDAEKPLTQFAAMANLHISEAFLCSSLEALRTHGGRGYLAGASTEQDARDALGGVIYSGTSDIQRQIIAKMEIGQRSKPNKLGDSTNG